MYTYRTYVAYGGFWPFPRIPVCACPQANADLRKFFEKQGKDNQLNIAHTLCAARFPTFALSLSLSLSCWFHKMMGLCLYWGLRCVLSLAPYLGGERYAKCSLGWLF